MRLLRFAKIEVDDMMRWTGAVSRCLTDRATDEKRQEWVVNLRLLLEQAGGLDGVSPESPGPVERRFSKVPFQYDPVPKRDERFVDLYNQGVNAEAFIYDPELPAKPKALMMLFKRMREIDVPEMMASIIVQTKGKPWGYYLAMTRQLWDEARHAMMGEAGFVTLGIDWTKARVTHNWSLRLNTECTPMERHAVLYFIEQGLMTRTGKRYEWELGGASGIPLMATIQDYDWADEVLHAAIGRQWYIPEFSNINEALAYGDRCWSRILSNWLAVKEKGLTNHDNWWPVIYREACQAWNEPLDPKVMAFTTTSNRRPARPN